MCTSMPNCYVSALGIVVLKEQCNESCEYEMDAFGMLIGQKS